MFLWLTRCCFSYAGWRRQHDPAQHARFCIWFGQRGRDDCLGRGKICCDCFGAICCVGAERVPLIHSLLVWCGTRMCDMGCVKL